MYNCPSHSQYFAVEVLIYMDRCILQTIRASQASDVPHDRQNLHKVYASPAWILSENAMLWVSYGLLVTCGSPRSVTLAINYSLCAVAVLLLCLILTYERLDTQHRGVQFVATRGFVWQNLSHKVAAGCGILLKFPDL